MTFSITAVCPASGMAGVAVSSSSMAVAARCAYARAGVGAVSSQNITDPRLGVRGLDLMEGGLGAAEAVARIVGEHAQRDYRQLVAVDKNGESGHHSGVKTLGIHAVAEGEGAVAAGNLLAHAGVPAAMIEAYAAAADRPFPERLLCAMEGGLAAGGEAGEVRSAGLLVVDRETWPIVDLRIDWCDGDPIAELRSIWEGWAPQMRDYVTRALDPSTAPAYGVPGDL